MEANAAPKQTSVSEILSVQDEKIGKVVEEVDRFFRSVHANIEDWKFAMEDDDDGTRIFVRFQIHIHPSGGTTTGRPAPARAPEREAHSARPQRRRRAPRHPRAPGTSVTTDRDELESPGAIADSDPDLAAFVEEWRRKRANGPRVEFHEEGAPLLDDRDEANPPRRRRAGRPRGR
jgi:hypothetical protein